MNLWGRVGGGVEVGVMGTHTIQSIISSYSFYFTDVETGTEKSGSCSSVKPCCALRNVRRPYFHRVFSFLQPEKAQPFNLFQRFFFFFPKKTESVASFLWMVLIKVDFFLLIFSPLCLPFSSVIL